MLTLYITQVRVYPALRLEPSIVIVNKTTNTENKNVLCFLDLGF